MAGTSDGKVSRDKNSGVGNKDFWVVKLRDKDKKEQGEKKALEAFPNPTVQFTNVVVGMDYDSGTVQVFDLAGREMHKADVKGRTVPVDLGQYPDGIYLVKVVTNNGEGVVKIMKRTVK